MAYSKKVLDLFKKPKNAGKIKNADGIGKVGNVACGDVIWLYIKVKEHRRTGENIIIDAKFQTFGCVVAIVVGSIVTSLTKGKTIEEALQITRRDILDEIGEIPINKVHCSFLAEDALYESIYNYLRRNKLFIPLELREKHDQVQKQQKLFEKI